VARRVTGTGGFPGSVFLLDAQALSLLADDDRRMTVLLEVARTDGHAPLLSAVTLAEQRRRGVAGRRMRWLRSRLTVVPATEEIADRAAELLEATGLDGHRCVVDALVVATGAVARGSAKVASSDASHIPKLCAAADMAWVRL
jgi:predicted nucleic acid-binding protein